MSYEYLELHRGQDGYIISDFTSLSYMYLELHRGQDSLDVTVLDVLHLKFT